jgi:thymidylate kinase
MIGKKSTVIIDGDREKEEVSKDIREVVEKTLINLA